MLSTAPVINDSDLPEIVLPERRRWVRITAGHLPARIAWRAHGLRVHQAPADLINVCAGGARVSTESPALPGLCVFWVGLESLPLEWVKANIEQVMRDDFGWLYRLRFIEECAPGIIEHVCISNAGMIETDDPWVLYQYPGHSPCDT